MRHGLCSFGHRAAARQSNDNDVVYECKNDFATLLNVATVSTWYATRPKAGLYKNYIKYMYHSLYQYARQTCQTLTIKLSVFFIALLVFYKFVSIKYPWPVSYERQFTKCEDTLKKEKK